MAASTSKTVIFAALAGNLAIAMTKLGAALVTGSAAMMSETIHSAVDTGNQIILLIGLRRAARPATDSHPFGHGLQLYFHTFVVAVLIFGVGAVLSITHGIERIQSPAPIENAWVNYVVLGLSVLFESASWLVALNAFNKHREGRPFFSAISSSKDPTIFTVLFEDTAALTGLVVALVGVVCSHVFDLPVLDGVASVVIGLILAITAGFLAVESQSLLTGEAADPATLDMMINTIPYPHDLGDYLGFMKPGSTLVVVGNMMQFAAFNPGPMVFNRIAVAGSLIGGVADTQDVLNLCAEHGIRPEIEIIDMADINDAFARIKAEDVRFRHVIDMASLKAEHAATANDREQLDAPTRGEVVNRQTDYHGHHDDARI